MEICLEICKIDTEKFVQNPKMDCKKFNVITYKNS